MMMWDLLLPLNKTIDDCLGACVYGVASISTHNLSTHICMDIGISQVATGMACQVKYGMSASVTNHW